MTEIVPTPLMALPQRCRSKRFVERSGWFLFCSFLFLQLFCLLIPLLAQGDWGNWFFAVVYWSFMFPLLLIFFLVTLLTLKDKWLILDEKGITKSFLGSNRIEWAAVTGLELSMARNWWDREERRILWILSEGNAMPLKEKEFWLFQEANGETDGVDFDRLLGTVLLTCRQQRPDQGTGIQMTNLEWEQKD